MENNQKLESINFKIDVRWNLLDFFGSKWGYTLKNLSSMTVNDIAELDKRKVFGFYFKESFGIWIAMSMVLIIGIAIYDYFNYVNAFSYIAWPIVVYGFVLFLSMTDAFLMWNFRLSGMKGRAQAEINRVNNLEQERVQILSDKQREQEEWQKQLDREIERERRLAEVRHESTLQAMQMQIKFYGEYKEKGLDIEKKIFELRKNLIELEGQENKAMLDEVRQALDELEN